MMGKDPGGGGHRLPVWIRVRCVKVPARHAYVCSACVCIVHAHVFKHCVCEWVCMSVFLYRYVSVHL